MLATLPDPSPLAEQLYRTGHAWWALRIAWGFVVPAAFVWFGLSTRARVWSARVGRVWLGEFLLYLAAFLGFVALANLPLDFFGGYLRERAYGLSDQAFSKWLVDEVKETAVLYVFSAVSWGVLLRLADRFPRRWWMFASGLALPAFVFTLWITPTWIAPLFNEFTPMTDKGLERQVLALASRAGVDADRVFEVKKSVDTRRMNAYVNGFGTTKQIVLFDTLVKNAEPREILSVVGHEIGHYVLNHLIWGTLVAWLVTSLGLWVIHLGVPRLLGMFPDRFGTRGWGDPAILPLALLVAHGFFVVANPLGLAVSRTIEHEADRFAIEITRDNDAVMTMTAKFVQKDLAYPRPATWVTWLRRSHPSPGERFDFAKSYRPWASGSPLRYEAYFRPGGGK